MAKKMSRNGRKSSDRNESSGNLAGKKSAPSSITSAHIAAVAARSNAYAPYSKFKVGAALLLKDGETVCGCNVENASYGGTICAERVAILSAVAMGKSGFESIVIVTDAENPVGPCGMCLQVMAEFFGEDTMVHIGNLTGIQRSIPFGKLLTQPFGPKQLSLAKLRK